MRIREPREVWILFILLWAGIFGGIPLVMLFGILTVEDGDAAPLLFLVLFPAIAVTVLGFSLRRYLRSGFELTEQGIRGAHDAESTLVPWGTVERLEWRWAGPTSDVKVNDRPLPSGPAVFAVRTDGSLLRVMQATAPKPRHQARLRASLAAAVEQDLIPVPFDPTIPEGPHGTRGPSGSGLPWDDEVSVTTWSSAGTGEEVPTVDGAGTSGFQIMEGLQATFGGSELAPPPPSGSPLLPPPSGPPLPPPGSVPPVPESDDAHDTQEAPEPPAGDGPVWPTKDG